MGGRVQGSLAKEGRKGVEVEDEEESRVEGPRFSTRRHKTTQSRLIAVPSSKLGRRPSTLSQPNYAQRHGNHIIPPWILAPSSSSRDGKSDASWIYGV